MKQIQYSIEFQNNNLLVVDVKNPFSTADNLSLTQTLDLQPAINEILFCATVKFAEMYLKKGLTNETLLGEKRDKYYMLLSQLYQPGNYEELLTKLEKFNEYLSDIPQFTEVKKFIENKLMTSEK